MRFLVLRLLKHSELGMFHEYRRQGKEVAKQRAVNFDGDVVDRVFPSAKDSDRIEMDLRYQTDSGVIGKLHWLKRQEKNWRLEGNCPKDKCYSFVDPDCLFAMEVDAGLSPAVGSWAVFPKNHKVTKAILADGESSDLASSAMIALHDAEGENSWRVLHEARPDLFTIKKGAAVTKMTTVKKSGGAHLAPNPKRLVRILASVGHTLESAVADIVDNAISADATEIAIAFGTPNAGHGRWLSVADNGNGMSRAKLEEAMRIGSDTDYEANALGKYGYGLKGASWSQTEVFTVVTRTEGKPAHHLTWDTADMDEWLAKSDPLEAWEQDATAIKKKGTVVLWKNMRPPHTSASAKGLDPHSFEVMVLERHLALVFHRFLEGTAAGRNRIKISINGKTVQPNNPVGHPLASAYDVKTYRIPTAGEDGRVKAQAWLLPSEDEINKHHASEGTEAAAKARDLIGLHGKRNETQGLFIYRHDRLIKWGGWHQMWETNDEKTKLARVIVNFDKVLDDAFKINISKQIVHLPQQLQADIKKLAEVARKDSQKKYRKVADPTATGTNPGGNGRGPTPTGPGPTPSGSGAAPTGQGAPTTTPKGKAPPRIAAKQVKTDKFVWKVATGLTGGRDIQVSGLDPNLLALVNQIATDSEALNHLADFLNDLDKVEVQKALLAKKGS